jgi:aldehyde:ferredoxin oxidoreductase
MYGAYMNRYLEVDLTSQTITTGTPDPDMLRTWIGGKGLGLRLLCDMSPTADPLSPENPLIFLTGPMTGTWMTTSARSCLVTRSPLTGGFLDSHVGGDWGPALKRCGYDYVIIKGKASSPVYLYIPPDGGEPEFRDAGDLWGKGIFDTERTLVDRHGKCHVASIGPAGENLVKYACISTRLYRQFGRGGSGAVMGSKNLKAVVADFTGPKPEYHDPEGFRELSTRLTREVKEHPARDLRIRLGTNKGIRFGQ